jgi:hypothetical protein
MLVKNSKIQRKYGIKYASSPYEQNHVSKTYDVIFFDGRFRLTCALIRLSKNKKNRLELIFNAYSVQGSQFCEIKNFVRKPKKIGRAALFDIERANMKTLSTDDQIFWSAKNWN